MIEWFTLAQGMLGLVATCVALIFALRGKAPSDFTVLPVAGSAVLLVLQVVVSILSPLWGNVPVADPLEFWMYLITDALMVPGIVVFALAERTKWANYGLALVSFANTVMLYRMHVLWNGH
ncbi:MAG: hypothetical protein RIS25_164 [Actinomycetota bacterium]